VTDDVRCLSLPGTYHLKIGNLGDSLKHFTRLKLLDLSRNALQSLAVSYNLCTHKFISWHQLCASMLGQKKYKIGHSF